MISADALTCARAVRIEDEVARRSIKLHGRIDRCGPCPRCGGTDRFSINIAKQVFNCRGSGGGDVLALVRHLERSAELLADFENQLGQEYSFDQDAVWKQAVESVKPLVRRAQQQISSQCRKLGIPDQFAPSVTLSRRARGYGNVLTTRRSS
jgi:hypothetical protein